MQDLDLFRRLLALDPPWEVHAVELMESQTDIRLCLRQVEGSALHCPTCQRRAGRYDSRLRRWRHLDTLHYRTWLEAEIPRVLCNEHGVHQIAAPWAAPNSRFTAAFEAVALGRTGDASLAALARRMRLSWDEVEGILERRIRRTTVQPQENGSPDEGSAAG